METINNIRQCFISYATAIANTRSTGFSSAKDYIKGVEQARSNIIDEFKNMGETTPAVTPMFLSDSKDIFNAISVDAKSCFTLPNVPISTFRDSLQGDIFYTPAYLPWQVQGNKQKNFVINYDDSNHEDALKVYRNIVMNILLAFPPHSVHLTFVNLQLSPDAGFFTGNLNNSFYTMVANKKDYDQLLQQLQERMIQGMNNYGTTLEAYNESNKTIAEPYEIVILLDDPDSEVHNQEQLIPLFEKGPAYGIYFIGMNDIKKGAEREETDHVLKHTAFYHNINPSELDLSFNQTDGVVYTSSFANDPALTKVAFEYLNGAKKEKEEKASDWDSMTHEDYADASNGEIVAPIGVTKDGKPFNFKMDVTNHVHGFIIGETGSGKSRFLHDIIMSLIIRYSPEDLELYLMDFKGIEFSCYKQVKHVRSLLVDRADEQITCEVFRDIRQKMNEREKLFREVSGASDLIAYNRLRPDQKLPQIILIADECQTLFADRAQNSKSQNEVVDIIGEIAQKGRAFGIHMLLATQSLANTPQLTPGTLSQIREHYILPCSTRDATRIVDDEYRRITEENVTKMQKGRGDCFYQGTENTPFTFNYISAGEMQDNLLNAAIAKAENHRSNGQVYFSGSLQFSFDDKVADYIATKGRKNIVASMGQAINLNQVPMALPLKNDLSENILLMGINDAGEPVTRTTMNTLVSLVVSNKAKDLGYKFLIFDCYDNDDASYLDLLDGLEDAGLCQVVQPRKRGETLKNLCEGIANETCEPTILLILGQERFRELKLNQELIRKDTQSSFPSGDAFADSVNNMNNMQFGGFNTSSNDSNIKTFVEAMKFILNRGPEVGVHTIMQIDKKEHFLFPEDGYVNNKEIFAMFKYAILLRSDERAASSLGLSDDIRLDKLPSEEERLRAYFYNEEEDKYMLFTPFVLPKITDIINLLNNI